ncbi:molybdopterin-synthase adenylyltransferase MoeB [Vibrio sp. UCD-FRSSP16_10]|uniref:molybdopterin-synthase adenylyltransferase MoeB n=1 Tax=unclassified Vibrio TaxID=2614977 RepID=UPI0007FB7115|nr:MULTISPECIES: molybdopterin-synthase adenylyltransferase MoeB [unclassified Vibrio]OBT15498.1 molybdopterin-synthase adenylyltransferase MoeB [Vibrio sp. UCD-FRSSP16_30]OBT20571.1 molybdopterin-synthase adenylyltransferase MoeB [Vibrio sp. UCD-FRSSP16_10]
MEILSDKEMLRYNRQIILRSFDFEGQEALKQASVLVIGAGGLGCAATPYLVSAGIGSLTIVDDDIVEISNLQRQILHTEADINSLKVDSAKQSLIQLNSGCKISAIAKRLNNDELADAVAKHSLVIDASDNLDTRNQLNRVCHQHKTPLVSGAAIRLEGQVISFTYQDGEPCYQCLSTLFGANELSCVEAGILAPVVGVIGSMQALEAIRLLANIGQHAPGKLMMFDALSMKWQEFTLPKQPQCTVCHQG